MDPRLDLSLKLFPLPVLQLYRGGTRVNSLLSVFDVCIVCARKYGMVRMT